MTHPIYSAKYLIKKGINYCKQIAKELGVTPSGDKREIITWVDAIIEHQSSKVQKVEEVEATIDFDGDCYEGLTEPYVVLVGGEVVHRAATYQQAERYCKWHSLTLLDSQTLAQNELEAELEVQDTARAEKAKSVEVLEQVEDEGFMKFIVMGRGSGRIEPVIEEISYLIEDINLRDDKGQQYSVRVHGILAGNIFLDDDHGWTMNGEAFHDDWRPVARELVKLTRREYLVAA